MSIEHNISRRDIDDIQRRNGQSTGNRKGSIFFDDESYKNRVHNGRLSVEDEYTGKRIFYSKKNHGTHNTVNVDHIQPIQQIIEDNHKYVKEGLLDARDLKERANSDFNLALTNEALNKSKGAKSNHEVIFQDLMNGRFDVIKAERMIRAEIVSEVAGGFHTHMTVGTKAVETMLPDTLKVSHTKVFNEVRTTTSGMVASGVDVGISAGLVSGVSNVALVMSGKKSKEEAAKDILRDTGSAAISGAALKLIEKPALKTANQFLGNSVGQLTAPQLGAVVTLGSSVTNYINGNITGEECVVQMLSSAGSLYLGEMIGASLIATGPLGLVAFGATMAVTSAVGFVLDSTLQTMRKAKWDEKVAQARYAQMNKVITEAMHILDEQRKNIEEYRNICEIKYQEKVVQSFRNILESSLSGDTDSIYKSLHDIAEYFDVSVHFKSQEDFDAMFFDDNSIFRI